MTDSDNRYLSDEEATIWAATQGFVKGFDKEKPSFLWIAPEDMGKIIRAVLANWEIEPSDRMKLFLTAPIDSRGYIDLRTQKTPVPCDRTTEGALAAQFSTGCVPDVPVVNSSAAGEVAELVTWLNKNADDERDIDQSGSPAAADFLDRAAELLQWMQAKVANLEKQIKSTTSQ